MSGGSFPQRLVPATSNVWVVGFSYNSAYVQRTLTGVTAISGSDILAVGSYNGTSNTQTLSEQWNGTTWSVVASSNAAMDARSLSAVAAVSASEAWAVGNSGVANGYYQTLIEHWNGQKWSIVASSNPGSLGSLLSAVTVVSASNAWTVGQYSSGQNASTLVEHWNGSAWSVVTSPNVVTSPSL